MIIVEHWNWRWAFFVNLPITAVAIALIVIGLKETGQERRAHKLDGAGMLTLFAALLLIFYALSHSAHSSRAIDGTLAGLIVLAVCFLGAFYFIERRAAEPIIPLDLFHSGAFKSSTVVATLAAMGVFGAISYLPLYLQGVTGLTASRAGMVLLFLSMAWTAGSLIAGQAMNRVGYRAVAAAGMFFIALGYSFFVAFDYDLTVVWVIVSATLIGTGMGMANLTTLVAVQNAVSQQRIGVATSTVMLFRTFGGAFAVSLMGTVLLASNAARLEPTFRQRSFTRLARQAGPPAKSFGTGHARRNSAGVAAKADYDSRRCNLVRVFGGIPLDGFRCRCQLFHAEFYPRRREKVRSEVLSKGSRSPIFLCPTSSSLPAVLSAVVFDRSLRHLVHKTQYSITPNPLSNKVLNRHE